MTSFARKGSTSIASHGKGVLRKSVSSPAAAAVVSDVHELVQNTARQLETTRPHSTVDPLHAHCNSSPRQYVVHEDLVVDVRSSPGPEPYVCPSSSSTQHSQHATPVSASVDPPRSWGGARQAIADGPVYSALRQEMSKIKLDDSAGGRRSPGSPLSDGSPRARTNALEASLEEAKTSNRLLSRALSAVQHRLKQSEAEREQLRRERDYFRQIAMRFPFTLSAGGSDNAGAARRFQSADS